MATTLDAPGRLARPRGRVPSPPRSVRELSETGERFVRWLAGPTRVAPAASWALLGAFVLQLAVLVPRHEPWFDEAQAWLLARDAGVVELFTDLLRYEGSPALWHLLLMLPAKLGLPYVTIQVVAAACATAGAALVAFRSPFPLFVRAGLLFSWAIGYQYAIVARSYVLMPVLLFAIALVWPRRFEQTGRFAVLLGLLATVSLHGFLIAGSIATIQVLSALRHWRSLPPRTRAHQLAAGLALLVLAGVIVAVLLPPADLANAAPKSVSVMTLVRVAPRLFNSSLTGNPIASFVAVAACVLWFWRTGVLAMWALPTGALLLLSSLRYHSPWHDGIAFLVLVFALWISCQRPPEEHRRTARYRAAAVAVLAGVLVVQSVWWAQSAVHDYRRPYSGSEELAAYLEELDEGTTVYATSFHALGALPYLDRNPYTNLRDGELPAYFDWSIVGVLEGRWIDAYVNRPDVIVWGVKFDWQQQRPYFPGYRQVATFRGELFWKNRVFEDDAFVIYERT